MNTSDLIGITGVITGCIAFVVGILQYTRAQKWRRAEFAAKEFKEFISKPAIANAMLMLDWNSRIYEIGKASYPGVGTDQDAKNEGVSSNVIDDIVLANALVHHNQKYRCPSPERRQPGFTLPEIFVRDVFDAFFEGLQMFENFIASGLVRSTEFQPYLAYWIDIIGNVRNQTTKPDWCRRNIWHYIDSYGYKSVQKLCRRYGYDIRPQENMYLTKGLQVDVSDT